MLLNYMKVKCETNSFSSEIVVINAAVTIIRIGTARCPYRYVSVDFCIGSAPIVILLTQP